MVCSEMLSVKNVLVAIWLIFASGIGLVLDFDCTVHERVKFGKFPTGVADISTQSDQISRRAENIRSSMP